jgi:hypothetical protein
VLSRLRKKNLHQWLPDYSRHLLRRARTPRVRGDAHLLFALCDHYEPLHGHADDATGLARVDAWTHGYPALGEFRDANGRPPRHGFFFPGEEYRPQFLDALGSLVKQGFGEVEVHLHHDGDTRATLTEKLQTTLATFAQHGHISRDAKGKYRWAFIHGNWSLANGRPDHKWCGVDDELLVLHELGCYADLTFPSAPDPCQPDKVNQFYWPDGDLSRRRSYEHGERARVGAKYDDRLLMITGPLALARKGIGMRLENGAITGDDPPTAARVKSWIDQAIHIEGKPEWVFVKVHTHGAIENTAASLLGDGGRALHEALHAQTSESFQLHYVTAREMFNVARAAMDGRLGNPSEYYNYVVAPPPVAGV